MIDLLIKEHSIQITKKLLQYEQATNEALLCNDIDKELYEGLKSSINECRELHEELKSLELLECDSGMQVLDLIPKREFPELLLYSAFCDINNELLKVF